MARREAAGRTSQRDPAIRRRYSHKQEQFQRVKRRASERFEDKERDEEVGESTPRSSRWEPC